MVGVGGRVAAPTTAHLVSGRHVLPEDDLGEDVRLGIYRKSWDWIEHTGRQCELLDVSEEHGLDGARAWLHGHGLRWVEATGSPQVNRDNRAWSTRIW